MASKTKTGGLDYAIVGMSMSEIKEIIVATFIGGIKRGRKPKAVFCWGAPGEGKTFTTFAAVREISRRLKKHCMLVDNATSTYEPSDVCGFPHPIEINGEMLFSRYVGPEWAWLISKEYEAYMKEKNPNFEAPNAIILFDDLTAAHLQTQSAFYKGVHEGKWGTLTQRDNVMVVGCGNRVEDNAAANDMSSALGSRFRHCYANPSTRDWLKWANQFREEGEDGAINETRIHPLVVGYIRTCEDALREFNAQVANRTEKAFACPRTWEDVSEFLWEGEINRDNKIFSKAVMGIIGMGSATQFLAFLRNSNNLISPEQIVKDPKKAPVPPPSSLDALHATIASLELHIKQNPKHWRAGLIYANREEMTPDIGILLAQTVSEVIVEKLSEKERAKALGDSEFMEMFERYSDLIDMVTID